MPQATPEIDEQLAQALDDALVERAQTGEINLSRLQDRHQAVADELPELLQALHDLDTAVADWKGMSTPGGAPAVPAEPLPERIGRYRVLACLGAGGMGTVYKAEDPELQRIVAVKVPRFEGAGQDRRVRMQRFLREARVAAKIRHPHVCPIYDVGEENGVLYVVMQCIEGQSLAERLHGRQRFENEGDAVELIRQVAEALAAVHAHGIVHRDLKPGNILLSAHGEASGGLQARREPIAVLTDFGLARPENDSEHLTTEGTLPGTPAYMAPEQAEGRADLIGPWTDLYSLGVVLYQMLTGRLPFEGPVLTILRKLGQEAPAKPSTHRPGLNPGLEAVVLKAIAPKPADRYQNAAEFLAALAEPDALARENRASPSLARRAQHRLRFLAAAAILLGVGICTWMIWSATGKGTLTIETNDPTVRVAVKRDGREVTVVDADDDFEIHLPTGVYELELARGPKGFKLEFDSLVMNRRDRANIRIVRDWAEIAWKWKATMPVPRSDLMLAELDGEIFVVGGVRPGTFSAATQRYIPVADRWQSKQDIPVGAELAVDTRRGPARWRLSGARWDSALVAMQGKLHLLGGWGQWFDLDQDKHAQNLPVDTMMIFDPTVGTWSAGPPIPFPEFKEGIPGSASPVAGVIDGKLYVYSGGIGSNQYQGGYFHVYDPATERWESLSVPGTDHLEASGCVIAGKFFLVGGHSRAFEPIGSLQIYSPADGKDWKRGKSMRTPRTRFAVVAVGGRLFALGGTNGKQTLSTVDIYDPATDTWTEGPPLLAPRQGHAAVAIGNTIYVFGGGGGAEPPVADIEMLDVTPLLERLQ